MNIFNIDELRQKITNNDNKMRFIHIVWTCLQYIQDHPNDKSKIGIFWYDDCHFMINTIVFGNFTNRKPNTMNRNFRTHAFHYHKTTTAIRKKINELYPNENIIDPKNWVMRWCDGFSKSTNESEAMSWKYIELKIKNPKNKSILDDQNDQYQEEISQDKNIIEEVSFDSNDINLQMLKDPFAPECPFNFSSFDNINDNDIDTTLDFDDLVEDCDDAVNFFT